MPGKRTSKKKMSLRQQAKAIWGVAKLSFKTAPKAVMFKLFGSILDAVLPLIVTFFAAATTTALAEAYAGDQEAGSRAITYVIITAALGLFATVWKSIDQYIQASMRYVVEAEVSDRMYERFLRLDFWHYDDKDTADLYDRARNFAQFFAWVFDRIAGVFSQFIAMVAGVIALCFVNVWLALFVLAAIIPGVYVQFKLSREQIAHWNKNVDVRRTKNLIEWNLLEPRHIAELRLYGMVRHLLKLRALMRDKDERFRIDFERKYMAKRIGADGLEATAEMGTLLWIVFQIINGLQPIGQFIYVQQVVSRALGGASGFVSQLSSIDEDIANLFDYETFMELSERKGGTVAISDAPEKIVFENVSFHYPTRTEIDVLQNVSLTIRRNQHVAIVGENGAGKSTFIKLLCGLYHPSDGSIKIDDTDIINISIDDWHRQLSVLQQDFLRYGFASAKDNVLYGDVSKNSRGDFEQALDEAEATDFISKLPQKEDTFINNWMEDAEGNKGIELSGGQWQRLALARNFYRDAPIIILDEPTSAIDALAEARIFDHLFKEKQKTVITISHRLTTVEKADVIYVFEEGAVVESGNHKELVAKKGSYYTMFEAQLGENRNER